ncbi:hypothetical protein KPL71_019706 [Citrus sinensis]|uniref:Uncharacterized protein n=1 Tax=Citrus sinensis TaxID=2711 RepID=A0ACB8J2Y1_CITSI|nr:hypothetical protein KPL71_019706 [Citrus sinensis]
MVQRTVLKVDISCQKCKKQLLRAVSSIQGVDKIEIDAAKGTLTVTGDADAYEIIVRTRKVGKFVEVVSIGPPSAPPKQDAQTMPEGKKPEKKSEQKAQIHNPHTCPLCDRMTVVHMDQYQEPTVSCSVM